MRRLSLACSVVLLAIPGTAYATPPDLFGYGSRSTGLAMTGTSYSTDYEAVFANPAGLGRARTRGLSLGLHGHGFVVDLDGERFPLDASRGMTIGFHLPLPFGGPLEDRIVVGGGFFTPAEALLAGEIRFPDVPQFLVLSRSQAAAIQVGVGVDLHGLVDGLQIGGGVSVAADVTGDLFVRLDETNAFSSVVETQLLAAYAPLFGVSYQFQDIDLGLGLVYRHQLKGVMNLEVSASDLPLEIPVLTVGGVVIYAPPTIALEAYYDLGDLRLIANLTTRLWTAYPGPQQKTSVSSNLAPDPDFGVALSPRIAAEWTVHRGRVQAQLRGGYALELSPAPAASMRPQRDRNGQPTSTMIPTRYLDNHRQVFTLGGGIRYDLNDDPDDDAAFTFDLYTQLHWMMPREHDIGRTDGAAPMETSGVILGGGWSMGLEF